MAFVVAVTLVARTGQEARLAEILRSLSPRALAEPGCLAHHVSRSMDVPTKVFVYERYVNEAAFQVDQESEHFRSLVLGEGLDLLESSDRAFFQDI